MNSEVEAQNDVRVEEAKKDVWTEPEQEIKFVADRLPGTHHEGQSASGDPAARAELSSNELRPAKKEVLPPGLPRTNPVKPEAAARAPRPRKFALLVASMAFAAATGAVGASFGAAIFSQFFAPASVPKFAPQPASSEHANDVPTLTEAVNGLRANIKAGENVSALRAPQTTSTGTSAGQLSKTIETAEETEHKQAERHATATALDTKRSIAPIPETTARPRMVEGWVLRKAVRDIALVQSRHGVIEVEAGDDLPGIGRVEEIKRQDGRWVVVTPKGLIVGQQ
jgi:hypothetical protein